MRIADAVLEAEILERAEARGDPPFVINIHSTIAAVLMPRHHVRRGAWVGFAFDLVVMLPVVVLSALFGLWVSGPVGSVLSQMGATDADGTVIALVAAVAIALGELILISINGLIAAESAMLRAVSANHGEGCLPHIAGRGCCGRRGKQPHAGHTT